MEIDYVSIGKRIRERRIVEKMTQAELAELSGVEPSNISHIERAATKVSLPTLLQIANALNVSLDELVCGTQVRFLTMMLKKSSLLLRLSQTEVRLRMTKHSKSVRGERFRQSTA